MRIALWGHPRTALDFLRPEGYQQIAATRERGTFDMAFFADRLAASTSYYPPHHIARIVATLDHLSGGRAAWNVVTSVNRGDAENFGYEEHLEHDRRLVHPLVRLSTLSSHMGFDFSRHPLDGPLGAVPVQGMQGLFAAIRAFGEGEHLTLRSIGELYGRSVLVPHLAGTAAQVADSLEALFLERACDGSMISPVHLPGAFEDFVDGVVPELRRRNLIRPAYHGTTLRDHLGIGPAAPWH